MRVCDPRGIEGIWACTESVAYPMPPHLRGRSYKKPRREKRRMNFEDIQITFTRTNTETDTKTNQERRDHRFFLSKQAPVFFRLRR